MSLVIGLHGAKGSGKDQFYKAAKAAFPQLQIRKIAYADPIKDQVCRIFGFNSEEEYDDFKRTFVEYKLGGGFVRNIHGRQVVREIGMMMRGYDENQFVKYVEKTILNDPTGIWCITDLRFDNELRSIKENLNGLVIKIKRSGVEFDGHVTEQEFPDSVCSSVIRNIDLTLDQYNTLAAQEMANILQTIGVIKEST